MWSLLLLDPLCVSENISLKFMRSCDSSWRTCVYSRKIGSTVALVVTFLPVFHAFQTSLYPSKYGITLIILKIIGNIAKFRFQRICIMIHGFTRIFRILIFKILSSNILQVGLAWLILIFLFLNSYSSNDLTIGWQNLNPLSQPNET